VHVKWYYRNLSASHASAYFSWADFGDSLFVILSPPTCAMYQNVPTNVTISITSTKVEMIHSELYQNPIISTIGYRGQRRSCGLRC
jgi:hypothetical protein